MGLYRPSPLMIWKRRYLFEKTWREHSCRSVMELQQKLEKYQRDTMLETRFTTAKDIYR